MEQEGEQRSEDQNRSRQIQPLHAGIDARPEQIIEGHGPFRGGQPGLEIGNRARRDQQKNHEYVGRPGLEQRHHLKPGTVILQIVQLADPFSVPLFAGRKVEDLLRNQEAGPCGGNDDQQPDDAAHQGRKFRAKQAGNDPVGNGEGKPGEQREFPDAEPFGEGPPGTEEPRHHADHDQRDQKADQAMQRGNLDSNLDQIVSEGHRCDGLFDNRLTRKPGIDTDKNRRADCPE